MTSINQLTETSTLNSGDQFAIYSVGNSRTRQLWAYDASLFFNQIITGASISISASTNVITLTLGNGQVITGSVTP